jgi:type II secretory pathway component PulC
MINKIKDFLKKKQSRKPSDNLSNQDEISSIDDRTGDHKIENLSDTSAHSSLDFKDKVKTSIFKAQFYLNKLRANPQAIFSSLGSRGDKSLLSPNLNKAIEKILSRSSREPIHQFGLVLIICSITFTVAKISALVARGTPSLDQSQDFGINISLENEFNAGTLAQVKSINIFRTNTGLGGKKNIIADKKCDEAQQRSSLPIKLLNTIVLQDTVKSIASVQIRGERELQEFRVGDQISTFAKIFKISRLEILVKNLESGMCESISSDLKNSMSSSPISVMTPAQSREYKANKKLPGIENNGNKFAISKTLLDEKLKDIAAVLTQAKAVKIQNPDGSLSFKMTELDPQGIFPYLGIQDQDIITSINGKPIYDMNEVMLLFGRIKGLDNLSLGIKRDGSESVQDYTIKK